MSPRTARSAGPRTPRTKTPEEALAALMRLCARAEKSTGDALRLMQGWGVAPEARSRVVQQLIDQRFIDDRRFAEAYVREKTRLSGWGAYKIRVALQRKGIDRAIIDETLQQVDPDTQRERLASQLARKLRSTRAANDYELKTKLIRYGLSLGYDYEAVRDCADRILKTDEDPCNDFFF